MEVRRISSPDGRILGFNVDGRIIERNDSMCDDLSMRDLEIRMLHKLFTAALDSETREAKRLMDLERLRRADLQ